MVTVPLLESVTGGTLGEFVASCAVTGPPVGATGVEAFGTGAGLEVA